jgi:hypothetical protein
VDTVAEAVPPGGDSNAHVPTQLTPLPQTLPAQGQQLQPASFWDHPEMVTAVADLARKVPEILEKKWEHELRAEGARAKWGSGGSAAVVVLIVGAVCWLTVAGKLSADAATFVFGILIASALGFLRDFFPSAK